MSTGAQPQLLEQWTSHHAYDEQSQTKFENVYINFLSLYELFRMCHAHDFCKIQGTGQRNSENRFHSLLIHPVSFFAVIESTNTLYFPAMLHSCSPAIPYFPAMLSPEEQETLFLSASCVTFRRFNHSLMKLTCPVNDVAYYQCQEYASKK